MGLTFLEIETGNPANPDVTEKLEFLIDSGAIYSVVPAAILERLGIKPPAEQECGSIQERGSLGKKSTKQGTGVVCQFRPHWI